MFDMPGLIHETAAVSLLGLWVRIPPKAWMSVCCQCCVLSGRGLCVGLITRPEESYRVRCVSVRCEASIIRSLWPSGGFCAVENKSVDCSYLALAVRGNQITPTFMCKEKNCNNYAEMISRHCAKFIRPGVRVLCCPVL